MLCIPRLRRWRIVRNSRILYWIDCLNCKKISINWWGRSERRMKEEDMSVCLSLILINLERLIFIFIHLLRMSTWMLIRNLVILSREGKLFSNLCKRTMRRIIKMWFTILSIYQWLMMGRRQVIQGLTSIKSEKQYRLIINNKISLKM